MKPILIRGRGPLMAALGLVAFGVFLATGMIKKETAGEAREELLIGTALRDAINQRSFLEYTTVGGETLSSLAKQLRIREPQQLRDVNPVLAKVADKEPLQPRLKLRVVYNGLDLGEIPASSERR